MKIYAVTSSAGGGIMDASSFMMQTIKRQSLPLARIRSVATRLKPDEIGTLRKNGFEVKLLNPEEDDPDGSVRRNLNSIQAQKALA